MKCPAKTHYEVCVDNWALACPGLTDIVLPANECTEGCECDDGFLFNGEKCIKEKDCGCFDNGRSYKVKVNMTRGLSGNDSLFFFCTFALIAMPLHCLCSQGRWCTKKTVKKNVPASQTKASSVKNIPALQRPNAWSEKELGHATTQARQHN